MEKLNLQPESVFGYFMEINEIPRGSKNEAQISAHLQEFGKSLGYETIADEVGNGGRGDTLKESHRVDGVTHQHTSRLRPGQYLPRQPLGGVAERLWRVSQPRVGAQGRVCRV